MKIFLAQVENYLKNLVAPVSYELDFNQELLKEHYQQLTRLGALNLLIPTTLGGLGGEREDWIHYNMCLAEYSGALLFLQAQHQFAIAQFKSLLPDEKIEKTLQSLAKNNKGLGIAIAANRKILDVKKVAQGFLISGTLPWVTGYTYYPYLLFSFDYAGSDYYTLLPFETLAPSLTLSGLLETVVFKATNTVTITLQEHFIPENELIAIRPFKPKLPTEHPAIYNFLGATKALLKIASAEKYSDNLKAKKAINQLSYEWHNHYQLVIKGRNNPFELRANALKFAEKCLAVTKSVCGSRGLLQQHPVARISREIWQYSMAGYSEDQFEAYLNELQKNTI